MIGKVNRVLLIIDDSGALVYGHAIVWHMSELDYYIKDWQIHSLHKWRVLYKDFSEASEVSQAILEKRFKVCKKEMDTFVVDMSFDNSELIFLEQKMDQENFNPFSNLCTWANFHYNELDTCQFESQDFLRAHMKDVETIKTKYSIDLYKYPYLLGVFTEFDPVRLEESFRGLADQQTTGYSITMQDYFNLYSGALVTIKSNDDNQKHTHSYELDENTHLVNSGFVPNFVTTTVEHDQKIIFISSFYLIKSISLNSHIISEKHIKYKDRVITQTVVDRSKFDV
ncbi:hypothetical protein [Pseudomonas syringae]|uniref:Uncharacterized protein n=1 Tax=Pseudomonas syringae TaxID=317 RepID=A0A085VIC7_PSESX|nr:hypothetical protein [Pseudomonas syringae]KFE55190.1 hypothetical protein IV01_13405 [Pseudomonas syringae]